MVFRSNSSAGNVAESNHRHGCLSISSYPDAAVENRRPERHGWYFAEGRQREDFKSVRKVRMQSSVVPRHRRLAKSFYDQLRSHPTQAQSLFYRQPFRHNCSNKTSRQCAQIEKIQINPTRSLALTIPPHNLAEHNQKLLPHNGAMRHTKRRPRHPCRRGPRRTLPLVLTIRAKNCSRRNVPIRDPTRQPQPRLQRIQRLQIALKIASSRYSFT